ncbi:hypothetical protein BSL78_19410 [Apostichopus japonicus]|uniref:Dynein axonemal assembly factor 5 TPR repeats domain-containing protein n=1 Tax=Stichopus japonicus TaxID=307972 RepID=A0A2G8K710_STIJA|nr:hypothetical protein BSL78_19410 [Apostichopus japonicus]
MPVPSPDAKGGGLGVGLATPPCMDTFATDVVKLLHSSKKLDRDKGISQLQDKMSKLTEEEFQKLQETCLTALADKAMPWEAKQGSLMATKLLLQSDHLTSHSWTGLRDCCISCLGEEEMRVRSEAGEVLGELCKKSGADVYTTIRSVILDGVKTNLERLPLEEVPKTPVKAEQIFHDTAGWKNLETWMRCLQAVVEGCGPGFLSFIDQDLLDLVFGTLTHTNRFVRETGYYVCAAIVSCNGREGENVSTDLSENTILKYGQDFSQHFANGLADNWSQVRLAASVATRQFLTNMPSEESRHEFFGILVPRLCLNRYYVAEGVKIYCQETWRQIVGEQGKALVEKYIEEVVNFYVEQSDADNHAVREAACACIAELGSKIDKEKVRPYVQRLLMALLICFEDDSWPVRDAACVACGNFILCFPEEASSYMEKLLPLFFGNLEDNILSVRQGAAISLGKVANVYGNEVEKKLLEKVQEGFDGVENQDSFAKNFGGLESTPATFGVVKSLRDNDVELHSDKQMYSCGSLAPKMGKGREGGCMDHKFRKPSEPWELGDGCINLLAELSSIPRLSQQVSNLLPSLAKVLEKRNYPQHLVLLETACLQIPVIGGRIGKRYFKPQLEGFFEAIFYSLSCDNALTRAAAEACLSKLAKFLGPNILKGRVELYNPHFVNQLMPLLSVMP